MHLFANKTDDCSTRVQMCTELPPMVVCLHVKLHVHVSTLTLVVENIVELS